MQVCQKCIEFVELEGIQALRLTYLYDGTESSASKIPPIEVFTKEEYKKYGKFDK